MAIADSIVVARSQQILFAAEKNCCFSSFSTKNAVNCALFINVLNDKPIALLNLEGYRLSLAYSAYGIFGNYHAIFRAISQDTCLICMIFFCMRPEMAERLACFATVKEVVWTSDGFWSYRRLEWNALCLLNTKFSTKTNCRSFQGWSTTSNLFKCIGAVHVLFLNEIISVTPFSGKISSKF